MSTIHTALAAALLLATPIAAHAQESFGNVALMLVYSSGSPCQRAGLCETSILKVLPSVEECRQYKALYELNLPKGVDPLGNHYHFVCATSPAWQEVR